MIIINRLKIVRITPFYNTTDIYYNKLGIRVTQYAFGVQYAFDSP